MSVLSFLLCVSLLGIVFCIASNKNETFKGYPIIIDWQLRGIRVLMVLLFCIYIIPFVLGLNLQFDIFIPINYIILASKCSGVLLPMINTIHMFRYYGLVEKSLATKTEKAQWRGSLVFDKIILGCIFIIFEIVFVTSFTR